MKLNSRKCAQETSVFGNREKEREQFSMSEKRWGRSERVLRGRKKYSIGHRGRKGEII